MKKILHNFLIFILIFLLSLALYSTHWALDTFSFYNFDEVLFQLTTPIKSASSSILNSYICNSLLRALLLSVFLFVCVFFLLRYLSCDSFDIEIHKKHFKIAGKSIRKGLSVFTVFLTIFVIYYCLDKIHFISYLKTQLDGSSFIEEHYVDPKNVKITFPEEKRNLIYIYAESMESTFFSTDLGGGGKENYLAPLQGITSDNLVFSDTELFGGPVMVTGTTWTSASMVSQTSGVPLKGSLTRISDVSPMLPGITTLGDILDANGYHQEIMFGSDKNFGNRGTYFTNHGNYQVYDYYTAIEKNKIDKDYYVWWGFEDSKLFQYAKEEITSLASTGEPFNFTMLTVNTHTVDGFVEDDCKGPYSTSYENSVYCSAEQIADFIHWIEEQDFYSNTTIVLVGDHVSMQKNFYPDTVKRRSYNVFIHSAVSTDYNYNRMFTLMDFFPTTLASLGATIEGNQLGLGTNLFSGKPTLMEEVGEDTFEQEISKYSSYYIDQFYSS